MNDHNHQITSGTDHEQQVIAAEHVRREFGPKNTLPKRAAPKRDRLVPEAYSAGVPFAYRPTSRRRR
jgi:hypothetical protein